MSKKRKQKKEPWTEWDEYLFQVSTVEQDRAYNDMLFAIGASDEEFIDNPVLEAEIEAERLVALEDEDCGYDVTINGATIASIVKKDKGDRGAIRTTRLVNWLKERFYIKAQHGLIYVYSEKAGCYVPYSGEKFLKFLEHMLPEEEVETLSTRGLDELRRKIVRCCSSLDEEFEFNSDDTKINFQNGVVSITDSGIELLNHSPEWCFTYVINADFISCVRPEELYHRSSAFKAYTQSSFADDPINKTELWLKQTGYCISDSVKAKAICFWIGAGNTGKSVMTGFIKKLVGQDAVSSVSIQELNNQFARFEMVGKKLNIVGEMSNERIRGIDVIKSLSGGDSMSAAQKGEQPIFYESRIKLLYGGNTLALPYEADPSEGFYNRLKILFFNVGIPKENQDMNLDKKIWEERHNIATLAVYAYKALRDDNYRFPEPETSRRYLNFYRLGMDSTKNYAAERLESNAKGRVHLSELYDDYLQYCKANGLEKKSSHDLQNYLITQFPYIEKTRFRKNGLSLWGIVGLSFKTNEEMGALVYGDNE